ncbi:MAG: hypothetical protein MJE68_17320 [Proteobacteria bacterium]|nr:hypothetical protein [Pseudomonadota bacterium]
MEQGEVIHQQYLCATVVEYVVFYGVFLKPCNAGSGYNPTLWILQCSAIFAEACGASLVFVAHYSE